MTWSEPERLGGRRRGFSLIELLVVVAILGILVSMGYSALSRGRTMSKDTRCRNNLKQIALGLNLYCNDHGVYPAEDLPQSLTPYVGACRDLFLCPADPDPQGDSYSAFYIARSDHSTQDYVCGCPRHVNDRSTITLFTSSSAQLLERQPVLWNGQPIAPGTEVGSGAMTFADGSQMTIPSDMVVQLIQSFKMRDGRCYSIVSVGINEAGTLDVQVTPGSRFEVVTPAAIAGVQGTRFQVTTFIQDNNYCVNVSVSEGEVEVKSRWKDELPQLLRAGQLRRVKLHRGRVSRLLRRRWKLRRRHLWDDFRFDPQAADDNSTAPVSSSTSDAVDGGN